MSNRDPRQRFDYQNWLNGQVAERAKASLTARDAAFAENNAGVTRAALTFHLWTVLNTFLLSRFRTGNIGDYFTYPSFV